MTGWADIAQQNQALLTEALEKLAAAERERDSAQADAEQIRAELVETAAAMLALQLEHQQFVERTERQIAAHREMEMGLIRAALSPAEVPD